MSRTKLLVPYIISVACVALGILAWSVNQVEHVPGGDAIPLARLMLLFIFLNWVAGQRRVLISGSSAHVMSTTTHIATLLSVTVPGAAILTVTTSKALSEITNVACGRPTRWRNTVVNLSATVLQNALALVALQSLRGSHFLWGRGLAAVLALPGLAAMALTYHAVNVAIVVVAISLTSTEKIMPIYRRLGRGLLLPDMSLILTGIVFSMLWHFRPTLSLFAILPLLLSIRSFESVARLRRETVEAVVKMAESIDYRDTGTYEHSQRIADMTKRFTQVLGLTPDFSAEIVLAARVHDLGKIGVSNDILLKQGPLTPEEREIMKQHPAIGASILESYSAFRASIAIVRHHHERWDGHGYPDGLKGEEIPLGSRIIGVVDAFDSMIADRPYRKGMSVDAAVSRLKEAMGTQFDPRICGAFIQMLIEDGIYTPESPGPDLHLVPLETAV